MLADGSNISLGPFGENNKKPLQGARLQQLVPSLFQLAGGAEAQACQSGLRWPARYRLDALLPVPGQTVNLAHLLLGHGGDLGWIERSEEHTSELQSLMRISYAVCCWKHKKPPRTT